MRSDGGTESRRPDRKRRTYVVRWMMDARVDVERKGRRRESDEQKATMSATYDDCSLAPSLSSSHSSPSDHFPVFTRLSINPIPLPPPTLHSFRRLHSIDIGSFLTDLKSSRLITHPPKSLGSLLIAYNTTLSSLLDKHAPIIYQTHQTSISIQPLVYSCPPCFQIYRPPCRRPLETYPLCCRLVLF